LSQPQKQDERRAALQRGRKETETERERGAGIPGVINSCSTHFAECFGIHAAYQFV
jgi:hypothetical protein